MVKWGSLAAVAVSLAVVAAFAGVAGAAASCGATKAFARFGDNAHYTLLVGGNMESPGLWGPAGSPSIVDGNEPFHLSDAGDGSSLLLEHGDAATFHSGCATRLKPQIRFLARATGGSGSLRVDITYFDRSGEHTVALTTLDAGAYGSWSPTPALQFLDPARPLLRQVRGSVEVTLSATGAAAWQVDDLYIDPFLRR